MSDSSTPFDDFVEAEASLGSKRPSAGVLAVVVRSTLQLLSALALWLAISTAVLVLGLHTIRLTSGFELKLSPLELKSALPLILIGLSYACLLITLQRTRAQRFLGFLVGLAFVLWGVEQYLPDREMVSYIDDVVVFLFVLDLSIMIRAHLKDRAAERRAREAQFPAIKTAATFDFAAQPSIDEGLFRSLLGGGYIARKENVLLVGNPWTGKTHLAIALGCAACSQKKRVFFTTAAALVSQMLELRERRALSRFQRKLDRMDLIILDEIGYAPFTREGAELLYEVVSRAYERASLIVTTTLPLEQWTEVLGREQLAAAMRDRLLDRAHFLEATGGRYERKGRGANHETGLLSPT